MDGAVGELRLWPNIGYQHFFWESPSLSREEIWLIKESTRTGSSVLLGLDLCSINTINKVIGLYSAVDVGLKPVRDQISIIANTSPDSIDRYTEIPRVKCMIMDRSEWWMERP